jgi:iron(III) transport system substrate-binding protein
VYPLDGTGARFDASGIIKNGPNPKAAELFMDFLTSKEAYTIELEVGSSRVVAPDLPGPGPLPSLSDIKLVDYDAIEAANIREELTSRFSDWIK